MLLELKETKKKQNFKKLVHRCDRGPLRKSRRRLHSRDGSTSWRLADRHMQNSNERLGLENVLWASVQWRRSSRAYSVSWDRTTLRLKNCKTATRLTHYAWHDKQLRFSHMRVDIKQCMDDRPSNLHWYPARTDKTTFSRASWNYSLSSFCSSACTVSNSRKKDPKVGSQSFTWRWSVSHA